MELNNNGQVDTLLEDTDTLNIDTLEDQLKLQLNGQMMELEGLEKDFSNIGDGGALADTILDTVWDQFNRQLGLQSGEDFIKENKGHTLDLSDDAHIQTVDNFRGGY